MSDSRKFVGGTNRKETIAAARPILQVAKEVNSPVREVRCSSPQNMATPHSGISFALGRRDTLYVTIWGHNRRQSFTVKARKPHSNLDAMEAIRNRWEASNPIPKNFRGIPIDVSGDVSQTMRSSRGTRPRTSQPQAFSISSSMGD